MPSFGNFGIMDRWHFPLSSASLFQALRAAPAARFDHLLKFTSLKWFVRLSPARMVLRVAVNE